MGSPDRSWRRFRHPRLRKCQFEAEIEFRDILSHGVDGAVWKVDIGGRAFALKVVSLLSLSLPYYILSTNN